MRRLLTSLLILTIGTLYASAQRTLHYEDKTNKDEVFDIENQAGVVLRCKSDKKILNFESNVDDKVNLYDVQTDEETGEQIYYLIFEVKTSRMTLTVKAEGYNPLDIQIALEPQRIYTYHLFDPDDNVEQTYYQKNRKLGQTYFDECNYLAARDAFLLAKNWDKASAQEKKDAEGLVTDCDSILAWRHKGYLAADCLDFEHAIEYFQSIMQKNPKDQIIIEMLDSCNIWQDQRSAKYYEAGNIFLKEKEYEDAILMYKKVEARNGLETSQALTNRLRAEEFLQRKNNFDRYFGWEFGKVAGITSGTYRKRTSGYVTFKANSALFDLFQEKYNLDKNAEIDFSFGWTFPLIKQYGNIFRGVWLHAGIGVAVLNHFKLSSSALSSTEWKEVVTTEDRNAVTQADLNRFIDTINEGMDDNDKKTPKDYLDLELGFAGTPEIGLTVKVWHFALRATYQYRYTLNQDFENRFKKSQINFGIGYCW